MIISLFEIYVKSHNPKVVSSNLAPATRSSASTRIFAR